MANKKFNIGDKVRVINYGSKTWFNKSEFKKEDFVNKDYCNFLGENDNSLFVDFLHKIIGQEGIINGWTKTQDIVQYSIEGIPRKCAWYDEEQLEIVNKNPNYDT